MRCRARKRGRAAWAYSRRLLSGLVAAMLFLGPWEVPRASAQSPCRTERGMAVISVREGLEEHNTIRDSLRAILVDAGDEDPTGALVAVTDTATAETHLTFVDLDPPDQALYRISGFLADHFHGVPPGERNLVVELDAPRVTVEDDEVVVCEMRTKNDEEIAAAMERIIRHHPDFGSGMPAEAAGSVRIYVGWKGEAVYATVTDSTGDPWFDEAMEQLAREMEFEPVTVDGVPVGAFMVRRLTFRTRP